MEAFFFCNSLQEFEAVGILHELCGEKMQEVVISVPLAHNYRVVLVGFFVRGWLELDGGIEEFVSQLKVVAHDRQDHWGAVTAVFCREQVRSEASLDKLASTLDLDLDQLLGKRREFLLFLRVGHKVDKEVGVVAVPS